MDEAEPRQIIADGDSTTKFKLFCLDVIATTSVKNPEHPALPLLTFILKLFPAANAIPAGIVIVKFPPELTAVTGVAKETPFASINS